MSEAHGTVAVLATLIERLLQDELHHQITKFHAMKPPQITIKAYLERIEKYANCSPSCFVVSLIYIDRLCQHSVMSLSLLNVHRILITAVCVQLLQSSLMIHIIQISSTLNSAAFHLRSSITLRLSFFLGSTLLSMSHRTNTIAIIPGLTRIRPVCLHMR